VNSQELRRYLKKHGCTFQTYKGGSGHQWVIRGNRRTVMPMHGANKELGKGLVNKIKKDLGIR
jgi:mRNA interferase HicA